MCTKMVILKCLIPFAQKLLNPNNHDSRKNANVNFNYCIWNQFSYVPERLLILICVSNYNIFSTTFFFHLSFVLNGLDRTIVTTKKLQFYDEMFKV